MKAMKKIGAGILVAAMAMSMGACSSDSKSDKDSKDSKKDSKKIVTEVDDEDDDDDDDDDKKSSGKKDKDGKKDGKDDKKPSDKDDKKNGKDDEKDNKEEKDIIDDDDLIDPIDETENGLTDEVDPDDSIGWEDNDISDIYDFYIDIVNDPIAPTDTVEVEITSLTNDHVTLTADVIVSDVHFNDTVVDTIKLDSDKTTKFELTAEDLGMDEFEEGWYAIEIRDTKTDDSIIDFFEVGDGGDMILVDGSADDNGDNGDNGDDGDVDGLVDDSIGGITTASDNLGLPGDEVRGYVEDSVYYNEYFGFSIDFSGYEYEVVDVTNIPEAHNDLFLYEVTGLNGDESEFVVMITEVTNPDIDMDLFVSTVEGTTDYQATFDGVDFRVNEDDTYYATVKDNMIMFIGFVDSGDATMQTLKKI